MEAKEGDNMDPRNPLVGLADNVIHAKVGPEYKNATLRMGQFEDQLLKQREDTRLCHTNLHKLLSMYINFSQCT
jgi:hypothetical protein